MAERVERVEDVVPMKVVDAMFADVVTVSPETPLKEAAALLARHRISGLPVLEDEKVVGVVSEADIVARSTGSRASRSARRGRPSSRSGSSSRCS